MLEKTRNRILQVFHDHYGYIRTKDLRDQGIHHKYLSMLVDEGEIVKLRHGLYKLSDIDDYTVLQEALFAVPGGVICLGTALHHYNLTTWNPPDIQIAIKRERRVVLPEYPPIHLLHVSEELLDIGKTEITAPSGKTLAIYDRERVVCDAVRYRNKIGIKVMKEALITYLERKDRNLIALRDYAKMLRIDHMLRQYIEVLA
jgi:predicted transcriptional regulator of viral defense system